ncbi:CitMHS family transporter [Phenylobacterium sp.]|uniref:CitMHS family transporter n=1 Tax=Phenylobacterium sp. TaxID=1871053 RepID=UPI0035B44F87
MLTIYAFAMVATFMALVMSGKVSPFAALVLAPIAFGLLAGGGAGLGPMMLEGIRNLAPTGVMLAFAILYFGVMVDAGLFDPLVRLIVRLVGGDPVRIVVGTAILALMVSLDGDGSTTYIICCAAMVPLYRRVGLDPLVLTCLLMLACGVTNITPWGGPTARAASALGLDPAEIFVPLIPAMLAGAAFVVGLAYWLGRRERKRLGRLDGVVSEKALEAELVAENDPTERPGLIWVNLALTAVLLASLVAGLLPLPALFMIASALALIINYPRPADQKARLAAHAPNILAVISVIFAAGIFTGVLNGMGMTDAMAKSVTGLIPPALGPYMAPITAVLSMPFTFFVSNDAFFFGILPILAEAARPYGIEPAEMARAALTSQAVHLLSPLVPSTYLLVGLAGVELGRHQRFTLPAATVLSLVILAAGLLTTVIPFAG